MIQIKLIQTPDTLPLRQSVLKPFLPQEQCVNPGDDDPATFHFGAFSSEGELTSVATFLPEPFADLKASVPYRLRGMATSQQGQGQGYGQTLLLTAIQWLAKNRDCDLIWCNAREKAFGFYVKTGFSFYGDFFDLPQIGPHKVMYKYSDKN